MEKLILKNDSTLDWPTFLALASKVIEKGRISNEGKQYCYLISFEIEGEEFHVVSDLNKESDKLTIYNVPTRNAK